MSCERCAAVDHPMAHCSAALCFACFALHLLHRNLKKAIARQGERGVGEGGACYMWGSRASERRRRVGRLGRERGSLVLVQQQRLLAGLRGGAGPLLRHCWPPLTGVAASSEKGIRGLSMKGAAPSCAVGERGHWRIAASVYECGWMRAAGMNAVVGRRRGGCRRLRHHTQTAKPGPHPRHCHAESAQAPTLRHAHRRRARGRPPLPPTCAQACGGGGGRDGVVRLPPPFIRASVRAHPGIHESDEAGAIRQQVRRRERERRPMATVPRTKPHSTHAADRTDTRPGPPSACQI